MSVVVEPYDKVVLNSEDWCRNEHRKRKQMLGAKRLIMVESQISVVTL